MDTLSEAIKSTVEEAASRGSVISVLEEAKRLAARHPGEALDEIGTALTRESLRCGVPVLIGEAAGEPSCVGGTRSSAAR